MKTRLIAATLGFAALLSTVASANLVTNGSFETTAAFPASDHYLAILNAAVIPGWTAGYTDGNAVVSPSWQAAGCFYCSPPHTQSVTFGGPLPASSPDGGNFVYSDANYHNSAITQTIAGLTPGAHYTLTFYDALAEAVFTPSNGLSGPITAFWTVGFGHTYILTPALSANGLTGLISPWTQRTLNFTAVSATQVLSFLSFAPAGDPPLLLLDGVSLDAARVAEPGMVALLAGATVLGVAVRRRTR